MDLEEKLINSYKNNKDPQVLGELYRPYMTLVYGLCMKYLKNREDAKDAVMQIFEKLSEEIPKREIRDFRPWLYVLAKNHCLMMIRSDRARQKREEKYQLGLSDFMENEEELHPLDENHISTDLALKECIERLKKEQRECIEKFYFESMSYRAISENMKLEEKKVKSHIQNGKRNLKICLEEKNVRQ